MSHLTYCDGYFPFCVLEGCSEWDGSTIHYAQGPAGYVFGRPSASASTYQPVFGPGSHYCLLLTLEQLAEWYWRVQEYTIDIGPSSAITTPGFGFTDYIGSHSVSSARAHLLATDVMEGVVYSHAKYLLATDDEEHAYSTEEDALVCGWTFSNKCAYVNGIYRPIPQIGYVSSESHSENPAITNIASLSISNGRDSFPFYTRHPSVIRDGDDYWLAWESGLVFSAVSGASYIEVVDAQGTINWEGRQKRCAWIPMDQLLYQDGDHTPTSLPVAIELAGRHTIDGEAFYWLQREPLEDGDYGRLNVYDTSLWQPPKQTLRATLWHDYGGIYEEATGLRK